MTSQDLIITPAYLILLSILAYFLRNLVATKKTRKYFLFALWIRFFGAILIGVLYQFYYRGGDTYYYFYHSGLIWDALTEDFMKGVALLLRTSDAPSLAFEYYSKMFWYHEPSSYFVSRVASFFDLFTLHTYSATALFFASYSFSGAWYLSVTLDRSYPGNRRKIFLFVLLLPSTVVWGSGILKDSLTLGATYWLFGILLDYLHQERSQVRVHKVLIFILSAYILYVVKIYILIVFLIPFFMVIFFKAKKIIKHPLLKALIVPFLIVISLVGAYYGYNQIAPSGSKYAIDNIASTATITSYDIRYWTGRDAGSGYSFGYLDGTFLTMLRLAPQSIIVSLFRPFIWEAKNALMFFAALETLLIGLLFVRGLINGALRRNLRDPFLLSCLLFSLVFAFSVGFTYNFGTLVRYRIPMVIFFLLPLLLKHEKKNNSKTRKETIS